MLVVVGLVAASAFTVVTGLNSQPQVFMVDASADTTLSTFFADQPMGRSDTLWIGKGGGEMNWTLIMFNLAGRLRPGDLVAEARIQLHFTQASGSFPTTIVTGRLLTSWSEQTTTWSTKPLMAFDTRTATLIGEMPRAGDAIWIDATKQLNRWHSYGGPSNFGTVMSISDDVGDVNLGAASKESTQEKAPRMQIKYKPGPKSLYGYGVNIDTSLLDVAAIRPE